MVSPIKVDNGTGTITLSTPRAYDAARKARVESAANLGTIKGVFANRTLIVLPGANARCNEIVGVAGTSIAVVDVQGADATIGLLKTEGVNQSLAGIIDVKRIESMQVNGALGGAENLLLTVRQGLGSDLWWSDFGIRSGSWIDLVNAASPLFDGQIILDRKLADGSPTSAWAGQIRLNGTALPGPTYSTLSSAIGPDADGGAIGLMQYRLHSLDCAPVNQQAWNTTPPTASVVPAVNRPDWIRGSADAVVRARFYGPIVFSTFKDQTGQFVTVQRLAGSTWVDVTSDFDVSIDPSAPVPALARDLLLRPACNAAFPDGLYRVLRSTDVAGTPYTSRLMSRYSPGDVFEVAPFGLYFRLECVRCNKADLGQSGGVAGADCVLDNNDFIAFVDLFFANDPLADLGVAGGLPGSDGIWDNNDFIAQIDYFFSGCDQSHPCDPGFVGGGASGPLHSMANNAPNWLQTGETVTDRQLAALWTAYLITADPRVLARITDTLFTEDDALP